MKTVFSIRYKFLAVAVLLLVFCIGSYLLMATTVIKKDKTGLVFEYSRNLVQTLSGSLEELLQKSSDQMKIVSHLFQEDNQRLKSLSDQILGEGSEIVWLANSEDFQGISTEIYHDPAYLETYAIEAETLREAFLKSVPFDKVASTGEAIWQIPISGVPPLLGFARSVVFEDGSGNVLRHVATLSILRSDRIVAALNAQSNGDLFVVNQDSEVLLSSQKADVSSDFLEILAQKAESGSVNTQVFKKNFAGNDYLVGLSRAQLGDLFVISVVDESRAFSVVDRLLWRSLLFALMVATLAFIAAILFSSSLTKPIDTLVSGMKKVASGDLDTQIQVRSRDEISLLAASFNHMITDLKESRRQLEKINTELEDKVKSRTRQLEEQNQAVKEAQEALLRTTRLAAVGEIAGRAAHEVLNPLTSILSRIQKVKGRLKSRKDNELTVLDEIAKGWDGDYTDGGTEAILQAWKQPSEVNPGKTLLDEDILNITETNHRLQQDWQSLIEDTSFLIEESERISRIIQSMRGLSITKSERKRHQLEELLQSSVNVMADYADKEDIAISLNPADPEIWVAVDKDEFMQSFTNLIRNSVQSISEKKRASELDFQGEIEVGIKLEGEIVHIMISDNGQGIPEDLQGQLFESQFSTKKRDEGTGLGLNISRRFIRAVGGDIEFIPRGGHHEGAVFRISLPVQSVGERISA